MSCEFSCVFLNSRLDESGSGWDVSQHLPSPGLGSTCAESGRTLPGTCPSSSWPLRRPRIRPGRNGRQVTRRHLGLRVRPQRLFTVVFLRKVHAESGHLRQLRVVRGVEGRQSVQQGSRVQRAEAGLPGLHSGGGHVRVAPDHQGEGDLCPPAVWTAAAGEVWCGVMSSSPVWCA